MLISSIPQQAGLVPQFSKPDGLGRLEFIGRAKIRTVNDRIVDADLYETAIDLGHGTTSVIASIPFGTTWVLYYRKIFTLNCSVAFDLLDMRQVDSATFRQEWIG